MLNALSGFVVVWFHPTPLSPCLDVTIWDASPWCWSLCACLSLFSLHMMLCLPCLFVPPIGFLCIFTCLLTCPCLVVCHPCFNPMKLWTSDPNLHLSLADTAFCLLSCLFAFLLVCLLPCFVACHAYHASPLYAFSYTLHLFLPLLVCWFLVFAFACTHMKRGHMGLGHDLLGASKKGEDASMWM